MEKVIRIKRNQGRGAAELIPCFFSFFVDRIVIEYEYYIHFIVLVICFLLLSIVDGCIVYRVLFLTSFTYYSTNYFASIPPAVSFWPKTGNLTMVP